MTAELAGTVVLFTAAVVSFTPGFSPVLHRSTRQKPFQTVSQHHECLSTGLKPGVNEMMVQATL